MKLNQSRREVIKTLGLGAGAVAVRGIPFAGLGALALTSGACNISQADVVIDSLEEAMPIFRDLLPASVDLLAKAIVVAKKLRDAIKSNSGAALGFLKQLIAPDGLINQLVDTFGGLPDAQRRILSGLFLLANIGLRAIAGKLEQVVPAGIQSAARAADGEAVDVVKKAAASLEPTLKSLRF